MLKNKKLIWNHYYLREDGEKVGPAHHFPILPTAQNWKVGEFDYDMYGYTMQGDNLNLIEDLGEYKPKD